LSALRGLHWRSQAGIPQNPKLDDESHPEQPERHRHGPTGRDLKALGNLEQWSGRVQMQCGG